MEVEISNQEPNTACFVWDGHVAVKELVRENGGWENAKVLTARDLDLRNRHTRETLIACGILETTILP